mgnify:CR=1 FL=1
MTTIDILKKTHAARGGLAVLDEAGKNALLLSMADSLLSHEGAILAENEADMSDARGHISDVMLDRLRLDHDRLAGMADGVPCRTTPAVCCPRYAAPTVWSSRRYRSLWGWCPLSMRAAPTLPQTRRPWR